MKRFGKRTGGQRNFKEILNSQADFSRCTCAVSFEEFHRRDDISPLSVWSDVYHRVEQTPMLPTIDRSIVRSRLNRSCTSHRDLMPLEPRENPWTVVVPTTMNRGDTWPRIFSRQPLPVPRSPTNNTWAHPHENTLRVTCSKKPSRRATSVAIMRLESKEISRDIFTWHIL